MEKKERFQAYLELATFRMEVRKERRQHEWRVSIAVWGALGAGMIAFKGVHISFWVLFILLASAVLIYGVCWVGANLERNQRDVKRGYQWLEIAESLFPELEKPKPVYRGYDWLHEKAKTHNCHRIVRLLERLEWTKRLWEWLFDAVPLFEFLIAVFLAVSWLILNCLVPA
jgi:hypothetical protein